MHIRVQKWGNSLAVRIPKPLAEDAKVEEGTVLNLAVSEGKVIAKGGVRIGDETTVTDPDCDALNAGLIRYNSASTPPSLASTRTCTRPRATA